MKDSVSPFVKRIGSDWNLIITAATKAPVFFTACCTLPPSILTLSSWTTSCFVPFNIKPSWINWTLLMAYYTAKLKGNGDKASPFFKQFLIGNTWDKLLPTRTLLYVSFRHIFISLTSFTRIRNSMRILYEVRQYSNETGSKKKSFIFIYSSTTMYSPSKYIPCACTHLFQRCCHSL